VVAAREYLPWARVYAITQISTLNEDITGQFLNQVNFYSFE